ncbi:MAG: FHA domain-containing protein [Blastocatellia bacterium]|nr:FHA domain-containing protein [Blastocatellia bacterium]
MNVESGEDSVRKEATNYFMQARNALKNGEVGTAERCLKKALQLWPDNYNYVLQLAKLSIQISRSDTEIERLLQQSSSLNQTAAEPRLLLAAHYEKNGQVERAVSIYKGVLNLDPNNIIVRRKLGQLNIDLGSGMSFQTLLSKVDSLIDESTMPTEPQLSQSPELRSKEQVDEFSDSSAPTQSNPLSQPSLLEDNTSLDNILSDFESGWDELMESIHHDTKMMEVNGKMHIDVGISYMQLGLHSDAIEEFEQAWKLLARGSDDEAVRCCRLLVDCSHKVQNYKAAASWCEKALELCGKESEEGLLFLDELARIREKMGDSNTADLLRKELKSLSPDYNEDAQIETEIKKQFNVESRFALRPVRGISGNEFPIYDHFEEVTIGRGAQNTIVINSPRVSKEHAKLLIKPNTIYIVCLSRTNGTYINGERIEGGKPYQLEIGDQIGLGKTIDLELLEQ